FQIAVGSPAINGGNNQAYIDSDSDLTNGSDLTGNSRMKWRTIDLGAYEYQSAILSIPAIPADSLYKIGDELYFTADFYAEVEVSGEPTLPFTMGEVGRVAAFSGLSEDRMKATFVYTVAEGD